MKLHQAKIKRDDEMYWNDVGLTVFMKDDGKVSIKGARTGEWNQCFEPKKRKVRHSSKPRPRLEMARRNSRAISETRYHSSHGRECTDMTTPRINLLSLTIMCFAASGVALVVLVSGCEQGYSVSGTPQNTLTPNVQQAINNASARDPEWVQSIGGILQYDQPPPAGVNFAIVDCPHTVVLFNTTFNMSVHHMEELLVHENFEIEHGCIDRDADSAVMVRCYHEGGTKKECLNRVWPS